MFEKNVPILYIYSFNCIMLKELHEFRHVRVWKLVTKTVIDHIENVKA